MAFVVGGESGFRFSKDKSETSNVGLDLWGQDRWVLPENIAPASYIIKNGIKIELQIGGGAESKIEEIEIWGLEETK